MVWLLSLFLWNIGTPWNYKRHVEVHFLSQVHFCPHWHCQNQCATYNSLDVISHNISRKICCFIVKFVAFMRLFHKISYKAVKSIFSHVIIFKIIYYLIALLLYMNLNSSVGPSLTIYFGPMIPTETEIQDHYFHNIERYMQNVRQFP